MSLRAGLLCVVASAALTACGGLYASRSFAPVGDYHTTAPKTLAEGGHAPVVTPPRGVSWTLDVAAFEDSRGGASHFEMRLVLVDRGAEPGTWRIEPLFEGAELVDDEGGHFPCVRALVPDIPPDAEHDPDEVPTREYTLVFEVPGSYRFRKITTVAVHWGLAVAGGETLRVTTRFRVD